MPTIPKNLKRAGGQAVIYAGVSDERTKKQVLTKSKYQNRKRY